MATALARLVGADVTPTSDPLAELQQQLGKLGTLLRNYEHTNHEHKRQQLTALHARMRALTGFLALKGDARQDSVADWLSRAFENRVPAHLRGHERALRVLEEALELAQAEGVAFDAAARLQAYVYARPVGDAAQEVGGIRIALLAYAVEKGLSADRAEQAELAHVLAKPLEAVRERAREKHSAGVSFFAG